LFTVPAGLVRILDRDLRLAGIPKVDERGRTVDVHAFRHTFGTLLSKGGVRPRTAQAAMRHSTIDLTMNVYTDPKLLDVAGAMEALPALPLVVGEASEAVAAKATGTDDSALPSLVPTTGKPCILGSILDKAAAEVERIGEVGTIAASVCPVNRKDPLTTLVNGSSGVERRRVELPTSALRINRNRTEFSTLNRNEVGVYHEVLSLSCKQLQTTSLFCEECAYFWAYARKLAGRRERVTGGRRFARMLHNQPEKQLGRADGHSQVSATPPR
jgi:hypothetical protein